MVMANRLILIGIVIPLVVLVWALFSSNLFLVIGISVVAVGLSTALVSAGTIIGGLKIFRKSEQPRTRDLMFFWVGASLSFFIITTAFVIVTKGPLYFFPFGYLTWDIELTKIEKPSQSEGSYGTVRDTSRGQFEDGLVKIEGYTRDPMQVVVVLISKTQHDLKIDWRKAKFVDMYGRTHPVEVTPLSQPLLENLAEARTRDDGTLTEIKHAQSARVRVSPLGKPQIRRVWGWEISGMRGRTLQVLFPLEVEGKSYEYVFTFQITEFRVSE